MNDTFRRQHRTLSVAEQERVDKVKRLAAEMEEVLDEILGAREISLAKTKLEECIMWAVKGMTK